VKAWLLNAAPVIATIGLPLMAIGLLSELILHRSTTTDRALPVAEELFPTVEKAPAANKIVQLPGMTATTTKPVALIVDDDYSVRSLLEFQLRADGWETICATDGIEAVQEANSFIDVVLLDVDMPARNGVSSMDDILRRSPGAKVIMVSGTTRVDQAVQAMKQGAFDYVQKPFNPTEVVKKARLALTMSQLDRQRLRASA
jgi:CheY-like chemotaxis protein